MLAVSPKVGILFVLLTFVASTTSVALHIPETKSGQALIFPIFTVDSGWATLVTITNTTDVGKAVRVRLRGARVGRQLFSMNVYLGPRDSWSSAIFDPYGALDGPASIATEDDTCTYPALKYNDTLPLDWSGRPYVRLHAQQPLDHLLDGREQAHNFVSIENETRNGYIEVIEMGVLSGHAAGWAATRDCDSVLGSWERSDSESWGGDASENILKPTGGLRGNFVLIHAVDAKALSGEATAIDGLMIDQEHSNYLNESPSIATGEFQGQVNTASVVTVDGERVVTNWERAIDAINAVLMANELTTSFNFNQMSLAEDWLFTFPTKPAILSTDLMGVAPFTIRYGQGPLGPGHSCERTAFEWGPQIIDYVFDNDGVRFLYNPSPPTTRSSPPVFNYVFCFAVSRFAFGWRNPAIDVGLRESPLYWHWLPWPSSGWATLDVGRSHLHPGESSRHTNLNNNPNEQRHIHFGLPVISFKATVLETDDIISGIVSNFSVANEVTGSKKVCEYDVDCPNLSD